MHVKPSGRHGSPAGAFRVCGERDVIQMLAHSVERRFIAIILAVLVLLVAPLFLLFFHLTNERYREDSLERGQIMLQANAKALGKPLWDVDTESVRQITHAIAVSRSVISV